MVTDYPICPLPHRNDPERPRRTDVASRLCAGHTQRLADDLSTMPTLYATLARHLVASGDGDSRAGSHDTGVNLDHRVVQARHYIRNSLATWVRICVEEGPWSTWPDDSAEAMATWLLTRIDWLTNQDWTASLAREWHDNVTEARSLVQPNTVYRIELGPCPMMLGEDQAHCPGTVIAVMRKAAAREQLPSVVLCTEHGEDEEDPHAWGPMQWHTLGRRMGRTVQASAAETFLRALAGS